MIWRELTESIPLWLQPEVFPLVSPHDLSKLSNLDCMARPAVMAPAANSAVEPAATQVHFRPSHQPSWAALGAGLAPRSMFAGAGSGLAVRSSFGGAGCWATSGCGTGCAAATGIAGGSNRRVTVPTEPAITSIFSSTGVALGWLATIRWRPGVAQTRSGSGVRPTLFPSMFTSAPAVWQSMRIRPSLSCNLATALRAAAIVSGDASVSLARNFSKASIASTGRLRSRSAWPMLNSNLGEG